MHQVRMMSILAGAALLTLAIGGCSPSGPEPKDTVIQMFGAMERNDRATLTAVLDLQELMRNTQEDYSLQRDSARVWSNPEDILNDLTGDGTTKLRWFSLQRIIGDTEINESGDAATVEVTFVNKELGKAYLTRFGLQMVNGKWRIHSFKTFQEPPTDG